MEEAAVGSGPQKKHTQQKNQPAGTQRHIVVRVERRPASRAGFPRMHRLQATPPRLHAL